MFEDLAYLFEQAAADGTPIRAVVGEDPVEFAEAFLLNYSKGGWVTRERERLVNAIGRAEGEDGDPLMTVQRQRFACRGLVKSYKQLEVLRGVDFDVSRGSIFALLGSNGAGKTTVVKILSTLLKANAGTAGVNGFDVATQAADVRESISLTGQYAAVDEILAGPGESRAGRPVATAQGPGPGRG
jgi:ABC-type glutathione transport system ATPase component